MPGQNFLTIGLVGQQRTLRESDALGQVNQWGFIGDDGGFAASKQFVRYLFGPRKGVSVDDTLANAAKQFDGMPAETLGGVFSNAETIGYGDSILTIESEELSDILVAVADFLAPLL